MMLIFADRGIQSGWSADSIQSTLEGIEEKFEKCNDKLAGVSVGPCSYQFQADKIEKMTQDLQTLQRYAGSQQIAWMLGAATGCIVSTAGMNLVFRNPKTGVVRECSLEEITSLEKLDASEIDITKLGKEVPTDDLELYMRYQKEGSIEHFTDSEKKTISRIETMGIKGDECEEILRARGKEVTRPPIEEPEKVLPPKNESEGKGSSSKSKWWHEGYVDDLSDSQMILGVKQSDKGLSTLGSATRENAMSAGKAWVGDNYNVIKDHSGNILGYSSADGMRAFRIQYKPKEGMWRANFQENIMVNNPYPNPGQHSAQLKNVHIDILD